MKRYQLTSALRKQIYEINSQIFTKTISIINFARVRAEEKPQYMSRPAWESRMQARQMAMDNFASEIHALLARQKELVKELIRVDRAAYGEKAEPKQIERI
jgi:hypothetical protein